MEMIVEYDIRMEKQTFLLSAKAERVSDDVQILTRVPKCNLGTRIKGGGTVFPLIPRERIPGAGSFEQETRAARPSNAYEN